MKSHIESFEMSSAIGSQVQLVFRSQFLTFTPDQFSKALKDKKYLEVRGHIPNPQNPQQPLPIQTFSKGNITVFLAPNNSIVFQILNTVDLEPTYKEVKEILFSLNIFPDIVSDASFNCSTRAKARSKPLVRLTSLVDSSFLSTISKSLNHKLKVCSIRLTTDFPMERAGGFQIIMEPLASSPDNRYYLNISYKTTKMDEFAKFVAEFGHDMIQQIIKEAEKNV